MIKIKKNGYWYGSHADDITEYLKAYAEDPNLEVKSVQCHSCGNDAFAVHLDYDESVVQIRCSKCGTEKVLLDGEEFLEEASLEAMECPVCEKSKAHNVKVGFARRKNGDVKWVYVGVRCHQCGVLGSCLDWKIDYGPTDEMEKNI